MDEVGQPRLKLVDRVHDAMTWKTLAAIRLEPAFADDLGNGTVGRAVVVKVFTHRPSRRVIGAVSQTDTAMNGGWTQIDKQPVRLEYSVSFAEGMDHALM
jgi:hypothetical protein